MTFTLICLLIALQFADAVTTYIVLGKGGREVNPLVRKVMDRFGRGSVFFVKVIATWAILWFVSLFDPHTALWALALFNALMAAIVINNVRVLGRIG